MKSWFVKCCTVLVAMGAAVAWGDGEIVSYNVAQCWGNNTNGQITAGTYTTMMGDIPLAAWTQPMYNDGTTRENDDATKCHWTQTTVTNYWDGTSTQTFDASVTGFTIKAYVSGGTNLYSPGTTDSGKTGYMKTVNQALNRNGASNTITVNGVPFVEYSLIIYFNGASESGKRTDMTYRPVQINSGSWIYPQSTTPGDNGTLSANTDTWGDISVNDLTYGSNVMMVKGMTDTSFTITQYCQNYGIAAIQIVNTAASVTVNKNTTVNAINTDASTATAVLLTVADGVTITYDEAFKASTVKIVSSGSITLDATTQPLADELAKLDLSGVAGKVTRAWLTPGIVGFNFNACGIQNGGTSTAINAGDTSGALASGGTWVADNKDASGSSTGLFADGLTKITWSSANVHATSSSLSKGTFMQGYLDDGGNQAQITVTGIPYDKYDVIIYCATDNSDKSFKCKQVNGTYYTYVDGAVTTTNSSTATWGSAKVAVGAAVYGSNAMRVNELTGTLTIVGGSNDNNARGCIAAIQIMPTGEGTSFSLSLAAGADVTWSTASWQGGTSYPTTQAASITLADDATITVDKDVMIPALTLIGTGTLTIKQGEGTITYGGLVSSGPSVKTAKLTATGTVNAPLIADESLELNVVENQSAIVSGVISGGAVKKTGAGTLTFGAANTFTNGLTVSEGMLKTTNATGYGPNNYSGTMDQMSDITVADGATLDMANTGDSCYDITIAGKGVNEAGALINSGDGIGDNTRQTRRITLSADAYIGGTGNFGLLGPSWGATTLALNGHKLTKVGSNTIWLVCASVTGNGTIDIQKGAIKMWNNGGNHCNLTGTTVNVGTGASLIMADSAPTGLTVSGVGTVDFATTRPTSSVAFAEGSELSVKIVLSSKTESSVSINYTGAAPKAVKVVEPDGSTAAPATVTIANGVISVSVEVAPESIAHDNPVTGDAQAFTWAFRDIYDHAWDTPTNWYKLTDHRWIANTASKAPGITNTDADPKWGPLLFDGKLLSNKSVTSTGVEGWDPQFGAFNGAQVSIKTQKIQGQGTSFVMVDETSKITFASVAGGNTQWTTMFFVAATNGIEFANDLTTTTTGGACDPVFNYYLAGVGSVKYDGAVAGTHNISNLVLDAYISTNGVTGVDLSGYKLGLVKRHALITCGTTNCTFNVDDAVVTFKDGNSTKKSSTALTFGDIAVNAGKYYIEKTDKGVYLQYIGYTKEQRVSPFSINIR